MVRAGAGRGDPAAAAALSRLRRARGVGWPGSGHPGGA